jgi:transposase-like protein
MKKKRYDQEFKEQIIRECQEVGNTALAWDLQKHGTQLDPDDKKKRFRCSFVKKRRPKTY